MEEDNVQQLFPDKEISPEKLLEEIVSYQKKKYLLLLAAGFDKKQAIELTKNIFGRQ